MIYPTNQHQPDGNRAAFTLQFPGLDSSPRSLVPSAPVPQPKAKRNGVTVPLASTNNSASGLTVKSCGGQEVHVDLAKDSDEENCKAPDTGSKKDPEKDKEGFDHTRLYFYPPGKGPKQAPDLTAWVCRWCPKEYALSAGLKALKLSNKIIRPKREEQWFLALKTVNKEDKDKVKVKVVKHIEADIVEVSDDLGLSDQEVDADDAEEGLVEPGWKWNTGDDDSGECDVTNMGFTLKKIDYICHQIASSPQKQAKWKLWAANQKQPIRGLIGGYGIRWNIALNSRQRAWEGRRVIKQLLDNKDDSTS
ncbi:hypothetical protein MJO28_013787 [Puccinia striiformis f. sp. tritici]|uniref:Uncharacterized protein n=1 Tax=Puccinia striiformis f. sp. tritici TaxID=168172 RepID=A0ACC0DWM2_9BASI|nr:hypothetical protein MJO28_013787 [Puccinia striiformis f. sp. tritici]